MKRNPENKLLLLFATRIRLNNDLAHSVHEEYLLETLIELRYMEEYYLHRQILRLEQEYIEIELSLINKLLSSILMIEDISIGISETSFEDIIYSLMNLYKFISYRYSIVPH